MVGSLRFGRDFRALSRMALDLVLPPRCLACGVTIERLGALCPTCWQATGFLEPPWCARCGRPFEHEMPDEAVCGACVLAPPQFDRARAPLVYDDISRAMVLGFKHGDQTHATAAFAGWMARAGASLLSRDSLLVPVPLHRARLFRRRYNQAALLALALARLTGIAVVPDLLIRRRRTPSQGTLSREERQRNVRRAFAVRSACLPRLAGRHVVLVDDVLTTGATAGECAATLTDAGAKAVDVLTLARVNLPGAA